MTIFRYLAKEIYSTLAVIAGILLLTFLSNAFVRYLTKAAAGKLSGATVLKIMGTQIPSLLGLLLPVSLFLAFLLAYGRMYVDNEMTVLTACGMSRLQLLKKSLVIATLVIIIDIILVFFVTPPLNSYKDKLLASSPQQTILETIQPGRFQVMNGGQSVFYIQSIDRSTDQLQNIFVAQQDKKTGPDNNEVWNVLSASKGYSQYDATMKEEFVIAKDGYRYFGVPGQKDFRVIQFAEYGARVNNEPKSITQQQASMTNNQLWHLARKDAHARAELEWRISLPLSIPILTLLAVPISRVQPRQGRYAQLLPAIIIYAIYANMMFVAKDWVANAKIPVYLGMWWLHLALLLLALVYWVSLPRLLARVIRRRAKS